jgi:hypothetical protein
MEYSPFATYLSSVSRHLVYDSSGAAGDAGDLAVWETSSSTLTGYRVFAVLPRKMGHICPSIMSHKLCDYRILGGFTIQYWLGILNK